MKNTKENGALMLPLDRTGKMLMVGLGMNPGVVQFTMLGKRLGMLATAFPTPKMLRNLAWELLRIANLLENKPGLRLVKKTA